MVIALVPQKKTLATEILRLRREYGSHDKLGAALGGASRTTIIDWERGAMPQKKYRAKLVALGIDPKLFLHPPDVQRRLRRAERQLDELAKELRDLHTLRELLEPGEGR
jgi:hypothetical protein